VYVRVEHPSEFPEAEARPVAPGMAAWMDQRVEIEINRHWIAVAGAVVALLAGLWLGGWLQVT